MVRHLSAATLLSIYRIPMMHMAKTDIGAPSILTRKHHVRRTRHIRRTVLEELSRIASANAEATPRGEPRGSSSIAQPSSTMRIAPAGIEQAHDRRESRSAASTTATASRA